VRASAHERIDDYLDYLDYIDSKVREFGWAVQGVGGSSEEPSFVYSVGLPRQHGHPEFVVVGAGPASAHGINHLAGRVRDGNVFRPGDQPDGVLPGFATELIALDWEQSHRNLPVSWRINGGPVDALQLVWPDESNRLPWEPGYSLGPDVQPLWGDRADSRAGASEVD
jgi:hypothetical protein